MPSLIERHHIDVRGRRVHYRRAGNGPPVLLLHESPRSSMALLPLLAQVPPGLTALALDTPGNGLSQPLPGSKPGAPEYADALAETLTALGIERAAVYGTHSGAAFATALAARHPQRVARLVIDGISAFTKAERTQLLGSYVPPFVPQIDGTHLAWLWSRVRDQALFFPWNERSSAARRWRPMPSARTLHEATMDLLLSGDAYRAPYCAAIGFEPGAALAALQMQAFVSARQGDVLRPHLARLPPLPPHVVVDELPPEPDAAAAQLWHWLAAGAQGLPDAPAARDDALPLGSLGDTLIGAPGRRLHLRGALGGSGRPVLWLHPSPGGARSMDRALLHSLGTRPVLALDLPCHGESDAWDSTPDALLSTLQDTLTGLRFDDAELCGEGLGAAIAAALAKRMPAARIDAATAAAATPCASECPHDFAPRDDGGHLGAAWLHARDEAILGGWWTRAANPRHDFGAAIDVETVHARAVECLKEAPGAANLRDAWLERERAG